MQAKQLGFISDHIRSYELFERTMGFQYFLNGKIIDASSQIREPRDTSDQAMTDDAILQILEQNLLYLFSALRPLEQESIHAHRALVRPVLESVPKCFFLMRHPESTRMFLLAEKRDAWEAVGKHESRPKSEKFLESGASREVPRTQEITNEEFAEFRNRKNRELRSKIYGTKTVKLQDRLYSVLSTSSHSNILRHHPLEVRRAAKELSFRILAELSFFNLFLMVNSQHRALGGLGLMETAKLFTLDAQKRLQPHSELTYLYPDNKEYVKNLILKPPRRKN